MKTQEREKLPGKRAGSPDKSSNSVSRSYVMA